MTLIVGQETPKPPLAEAPTLPCAFTPELYGFLGIPDLWEEVMRPWLAMQRGAAPGLTLTIPPSEERRPGPHVSHTGHSREGGLCKRQLWYRYQNKPAPVDYGREMGLAMGHAVEAWLAAILVKQLQPMGWRVERNLACDYVHSSGQILAGELDILVTGPKTPKPGEYIETKFIIDCKRISGSGQLERLDAARPSNVCQMQGYLANTVYNADFGVLAYVYAGEDWIEPKFFFVPPDHEATHARANEVLAVYQSPEAPKVLRPKVEYGNPLKDESRSVKVRLPWQCEYCSYLDAGCTGALEEEFRQNGMWGHLQKSGKFKIKDGMQPTVEAFGPERLAELLIGG